MDPPAPANFWFRARRRPAHFVQFLALPGRVSFAGAGTGTEPGAAGALPGARRPTIPVFSDPPQGLPWISGPQAKPGI